MLGKVAFHVGTCICKGQRMFVVGEEEQRLLYVCELSLGHLCPFCVACGVF